jgi:hypothetical protein
MLSAVTAHRFRTFTGLLVFTTAVATTLSACSSTTGGTGTTSDLPAARSSSSPDFPTTTPGSASATTAAPSTPAPTATDSGIRPAPANPLRSATVHASDGTTYVVDVWADVRDSTCFDHAYGKPMITFLTEHPCRGLERLLGTTTVGNRPVGFAESITSFPGTATDPYAYSSRFSKLERADGTGSINDLLREGYRLPSGPAAVPASEAFNVLGQDNGVTVWDVWYLDGVTPNGDQMLIKMTQDVFLQF